MFIDSNHHFLKIFCNQPFFRKPYGFDASLCVSLKPCCLGNSGGERTIGQVLFTNSENSVGTLSFKLFKYLLYFPIYQLLQDTLTGIACIPLATLKDFLLMGKVLFQNSVIMYNQQFKYSLLKHVHKMPPTLNCQKSKKMCDVSCTESSRQPPLDRQSIRLFLLSSINR